MQISAHPHSCWTHTHCLAVIHCTIDLLSIYNSRHNTHLAEVKTHMQARTQAHSHFWEVGRWETQHHLLCLKLDAPTNAYARVQPAATTKFIHPKLVFTTPSHPCSYSSMSLLSSLTYQSSVSHPLIFQHGFSYAGTYLWLLDTCWTTSPSLLFAFLLFPKIWASQMKTVLPFGISAKMSHKSAN